jgi:hypothetical protein
MTDKAPPYPADLEAKGWSLDLDYERIEQSDTWAIASAEQRPWLLMLWLVSWRQVPAASLPNSPRLIAARLGMPEAKFTEWSEVLLSGWELCSDGRFYHRTLTEHVLRMAGKRIKDRERVANFRKKSHKSNDDVASCNALHNRDQCVSSTPTPTPTPIINKGTNVPVGKAALPPVEFEKVVDLYHQALPELPAVRLMNDSRKRAIASMWKFVLTSKKSDGTPRATTSAEAKDWLKGYFLRVRENDFLMGRSAKANGHEGWVCDFDFLLSEKGKKHVIEKTQVAA